MTKKCGICKKTKPFSNYYRCKRGKDTEAGGYRYICKLCDNECTRLRRLKYGTYIEAEKRRQGKGSNHAKRSKIHSQRQRDEMSDMYIRSLITKKSKILKPKDISDEFVIIYRDHLKLKRFLREQK